MATATAEKYFAKMQPYAMQVEKATGIPAKVVLGQWALESSYGTSDLSMRANNHAGIKSSSLGKDYTSGMYAGYNSLSSFAKDYARVMSLSYYDKVRQAGKTGNIQATVKALDESPWAEDTGYYNKVMNVINGGTSYKEEKGGTANFVNLDLNEIGEKVKNLNSDQMFKFALIGLAVVGVLKIVD